MSNPFVGQEGFAVFLEAVDWGSRVAPVKRDTCFAAWGMLATFTELLVLHALGPVLRGLDMELMDKCVYLACVRHWAQPGSA